MHVYVIDTCMYVWVMHVCVIDTCMYVWVMHVCIYYVHCTHLRRQVMRVFVHWRGFSCRYRCTRCRWCRSYTYVCGEWYRVAKTNRMPYFYRLFFAKEPLIIRLFCGKWPVKIRHPVGLLHPSHVCMCEWHMYVCMCEWGCAYTCTYLRRYIRIWLCV